MSRNNRGAPQCSGSIGLMQRSESRKADRDGSDGARVCEGVARRKTKTRGQGKNEKKDPHPYL